MPSNTLHPRVSSALVAPKTLDLSITLAALPTLHTCSQQHDDHLMSTTGTQGMAAISCVFTDTYSAGYLGNLILL
jgi:hypothetical protein